MIGEQLDMKDEQCPKEGINYVIYKDVIKSQGSICI